MTRKTSVLPPPPVDRMKELYQQVEQRIKELHGNYELSNQAVTRKIEGEQGWSATLRVGGSHILQEGLEELADWWEENTRRAVLECPEPENARRQSITKTGRQRILRTVAWRHSASADILAPSGQWCPVGINISLDFDGQAILRDIIWPVDIQEMGNTITETMQSALGKGWQAFHHNRQRSKKMRIFEDWSGSTPAERKILGKQPPILRKPSAVWPAESQKAGTLRVCEGMDECGYEPKLDLSDLEAIGMQPGMEQLLQNGIPSIPGSQPRHPVPEGNTKLPPGSRGEAAQLPRSFSPGTERRSTGRLVPEAPRAGQVPRRKEDHDLPALPGGKPGRGPDPKMP